MGDKPMSYILDVAYTQTKELLLEQLTLDNTLKYAGTPLFREVLGRLPALQTATRILLDNFQRGQLAFQIDVNSIDQRVSAVQTAVESGIRRIVLSVLVVGLVRGSTLILLIPLEGRVSAFESFAIRLIAETGFVIGVVLTIGLLLYTLWQSIQRPRDS
jgi:hypothetical protein